MTTNTNKIVILGGRGMLGTDLVKAANDRGLILEALDRPEFDITNQNQLKEAIKGKKIIINCAAYTNVDGAESQIDLAYRVNAEAVGRLGERAKKSGAWVLHISTDFIFDGLLNRPYKETDRPNPINQYGKSKLQGEVLLAQSDCKFCVLRIQWTYGRAGDNFVSKLIKRAKTDGMLKVVDDQVGSPTATTTVAEVICKLFDNRPQGIFHFASAGYISRFGMAKFIFDKLSMDINLSACKSSDFKTPATRPLNSRFDCSKIYASGVLDEPIESWQETLERYLRQL
jgi:dTDP-4-dehydrorhamnose reductase